MFVRVSEFFGKSESNEDEITSDHKDIVSGPQKHPKLEKLRKRLQKLLIIEIENIVILKSEIFREQVSKTRKMRMSTNDEFKIPRFDGCDYSLWKKRILLFLKYKECDEQATRARTNENEEDWNKKNLKAMNIIYCSITNQQLEFIGDEDTAFKIMNKFDNMYLKKSTALQICVRNRLDKMRLRDYDDASTFFGEFERVINDLKSAGASVSEREKLDYMLKMLPDSMSYIGDLIDSVQENERTCEFLKNKISMWELKSRSTDKKKPSAFKAEKKNGSCHGCGKFGHFVRDCWANGNAGSSSRGGNSGEAQAPGGAHQQLQHQQQQRQSQLSRGSWRGGGRGNNRRGRWQTRGAAAGHYSEQQNDVSAGTFIAQIDNKSEAAAYASANYDIEWILDSGCSDHIINNDAYFENSVVLVNPIKVKVGDGRTLKGTKVGNVVTYFEVDGKRMRIDLLNVYYVKEMDKNLISFAKVTDRNKVVSIGINSKIYNDKGMLIGVATKSNGLYKINRFVSEPVRM